ncbi:DEAD/DEAH box helicase, partial [Streptomyces sp. NPDC014773]|uniref:DEAD/DEAH box helicase n=1 Tax=Streptomyces sp. NPDC014773 TaxID=3364908 RepID=UPI0037020581
EQLAPDHFYVIVIDEFHHATASTYRRVIDHFAPKQLLGLTATPERMDGLNVQDEFFDGRIAAEMRLWEALENDLLCPFHYFGIPDG